MVLPVWSAPPVAAAPVDPSFVDEVVNAALPGWAFTNPSALVFAPDGHVFVAEKSGIVKVFDSLTDPTATVFADLRTNVHNMWDRGLLGLAVHPNFPATPKVYVLYTYDAPIGGTAPVWGSPGGTSDPCPTPPGPTSDGCVVSGRLSALTAGAGDVATGPEQVLINDWCQQYPSHTIGDLAFGPDGALYVSAGDGASFTFTDFGQDGSPLNPCGDPPTGVGRHADGPDRRGRRAPLPGPPHDGRSDDPRRFDPAARSEHRGRDGRQPAHRILGRQCAADHRPRPAEPVPIHVQARDERGLAWRRRLGDVGRGQPDREPDRAEC